MWKAVSLAIGITIMLLGAELFFVEELEIRNLCGSSPPAAAQSSPFQQAAWAVQRNALNPPPRTWLYTPREWMPWSMLAVGTIIVIYTFTLPGRKGETAPASN